MRKILILVLLSISFILNAQTWQPLQYSPDQDSIEYNPLKGIGALFGSDNGFPHSISSKVFTLGEVMKDNGEDNFENSIDPFLEAEAAAGRYVILQINVDSGKKINPDAADPSGSEDYIGGQYDLPNYLSGVDRLYYLGKPKNGPNGPPAPEDIDLSTTDNIIPWDPSDGNGNPSLLVDYNDEVFVTALEAFIAKLGQKYNNDERVFIVHYGTYGIFGEWDLGFGKKFTPGYVENVSDSDWAMSFENQERIINAFQSAFPSKNLIARVPDVPQPESVGYSDGLFFGASVANAAPHGFFFLPKLEKFNVDQNWRQYPIGGEIDPHLQPSLWENIGVDFDYIVNGDPNLTKGGPDQNVKEVFEKTHPTFLFQNFMLDSLYVGVEGGVHGPGTTNDPNPYAGQSNAAWWANAKEAVKKSGYTFHIDECRLSASDTKPAVEVNIINKGIAPMYADWEIEFAYIDNNGAIQSLGTNSNWNLRTIQPDIENNYRSFISDSTIVDGTYKFLLRIVNPYQGIAGAKVVPVRFANDTQDADQPGWLTLGEATISSGSLGVTPIAATSLSIAPTTTTLGFGSVQQLTATILPLAATNQEVTWSSNNPAIADVDVNGLVTAGAKSGTATIIGRTENGTIESQATIIVEAYWNIPSLVEAEHFLGTTNEISINNTFLPEGGIHLANFDFGDEVIYGVDVNTPATFVIDFRMANPQGTGEFDIYVDGVKLQTKVLAQTESNVNINENGEYDNDFSKSFDLGSGRHEIKLTTLAGGYNLNSLNFKIFDPCEVNAGLNEGDICDDENPNTVDDAYDSASCLCTGTPGSDIYWQIPGRVEAEHWAQKSNDFAGVDINMPSFGDNVEGGIGNYVGGLIFSQKLDYQIAVSEAGSFAIDFRYAGPQDGGELNIYLDGNKVADKFKLQDTDGPNANGDFGDYSIYATQSTEPIEIPQGQHVVRLEILQGSFDLNYLDFRLSDPCENFDLSLIDTACDDQDPNTENDTYTANCECVGTPIQSFTDIPSLIEAEDFTDVFNAQINPVPAGESGGSILGFIGDDTWMDYAVRVSEAAEFIVDLRAASPFGVGVIDILDEAGTSLVTVALTPATTNFDTYQTYTSDTFTLPAGSYVIRLDVVASAFNLNWIEFKLANGCANPVGTPCDDGDDATSNDVYTSDCTCEGEVIFQPVEITLDAIHDSYLQNGSNFNTDILRTEKNKRTSYLKFDLSGLNGTIHSVDLVLTVAQDPGHGLITVSKGDHTDWTEDNLSNSNKPVAGNLLGSLDQGFDEQVTYSWDLTTADFDFSEISLILDHLSGNDVSFKSSESSSVAKRPKLVINFTPADVCHVEGQDCNDGDAATINDIYLANCACQGVPAGPTTSATVDPIHDAYLQGSYRYDVDILRVEDDWRTSYLRFDLSGINGTITRAELHMTVQSDPGHGVIEVSKGDHNNWTESNLSNANKPQRIAPLGSLDDTFSEGLTYMWDLDANEFDGNEISLIVDHLNGNDVAFASSEYPDANLRPYLEVEYVPADGSNNVTVSTTRSSEKVNTRPESAVWPNPFSDQITVGLDPKRQYTQLYVQDIRGVLMTRIDLKDTLKGNELTLQLDGPEGIYFMFIETNEGREVKKIVKN